MLDRMGDGFVEAPSSYVLSWFGRPAYAVATFLIAVPVATVLNSAWPIHLDDFRWRFQTEQLLSSVAAAMLIGFTLAPIVALGLRRRITLRVLALLDIVVALILLGAAVDVMLNGLQLRPQVTVDTLATFELSVIREFSIFVVAALLLIWIARSSIRSARQLAEEVPGETAPHVLVSV
jgi:hypothetical protein